MKKKTASVPSNTRIIKLRLTDDEVRLIRMAAASYDEQPGVFARRVTIEHARAELKRVRNEIDGMSLED